MQAASQRIVRVSVIDEHVKGLPAVNPFESTGNTVELLDPFDDLIRLQA